VTFVAVFSFCTFSADEPIHSENKFKKGSLFVNAGILFGCGAFGGEAEFGIWDKLGLQAGAGLLGLNAGSNFHIFSTGRNDLTVGMLADYLPGIKTVVPEINLGYRFFPGKKGRVGLSLRCGLAFSTVDDSIEDGDIRVTFKKGYPFLMYAVGVSIKAIKDVFGRE
jgi:hypothetical protein